MCEAGSKNLGAGVNLRPSGYEPDELPGGDYPPNAKKPRKSEAGSKNLGAGAGFEPTTFRL
jgi:hypothetical protein